VSGYHQRYRARYAGGAFHRRTLGAFYRWSAAHAERLGIAPWGRGRRLRVLLCGTGSEHTTALFFAHVQALSPGAAVTVLDLLSAPLRAGPSVQGDARAVPFGEWARVLRPGGLLATRDWITGPGGASLVERRLDRLRRRTIRAQLGIEPCATAEQEVRAALAQAGLSGEVWRARTALGPLPLFAQITAARVEG
jgi:hypothetical protein